MPNADRAAVAREVLTEYADILRDAGQTLSEAEVRRYVREHYPAPPAPETVTVDDGVFRTVWTDVLNGVRWEAKGDGLRAAQVAVFGHAAALRRIASDARVIHERDARIAELETQLQRALDGAVFHEKRAHHAEQERDAARARIAELEELLRDQPRLLYDSMWQAIDRMGDAVGTLTGPGSNCHVTATRVCETIETLESERDAALRALEAYQNGIGPMGSKGEGCGEVGVSTAAHGGSGATQPDQGESPVAAPSPAPIPLGETMEVDGVKWARTELGWNGGAWRYHDSSTVARVLTALYRARHPVATRETVERVAKAIDDADSDSLCPVWDVMTVHQKSVLCDMARAALTAAGFTLEEGA